MNGCGESQRYFNGFLYRFLNLLEIKSFSTDESGMEADEKLNEAA